MASLPQGGKIKPKTSFQQSRTIGPVYYGGAAILSDDGSKLFTIVDPEEGGVLVTSTETGQEICRITTESAVTALSVASEPSDSSNGYLVICLQSLSISIYDISTLSQEQRPYPTSSIPKAHDAPIMICTSSSKQNTGNLVATGSSDGIVKVWDVSRGVCTHVFKNHGGIVSALSFYIPKRSSSSSSSKSKSSKKGKAVEKNTQETTPEAYLISGSTDSRVRLFDLMKSSLIKTFEGHSSAVRGLDVIPTQDISQDLIVSAGRDRVVIVWSISKGEALHTITVLESIEAAGVIHSDPNNPSSKPLVYTGGEKGLLRLWDISSGSEVTPSSAKSVPVSQDSEPTLPQFVEVIHLPRASTIVAFTADQTILVFSVPSLEIVKEIVGSNDEVFDVALLSIPETETENKAGMDIDSSSSQQPQQESHLAVASNSASIRLYELGENNFNTRLLSGHTDAILCLNSGPVPIIAQDGSSSDKNFVQSVLISGSKDHSARIWLPKRSKGNNQSTTWTWSCVGTCTGHLQDVGAVCLAKPPLHDKQNEKSWSKFALTVSSDQTLKIWDLEPVISSQVSVDDDNHAPLKLKTLLTQKIHDRDINTIDVSPDNKLIATGSQDKSCKIFALDYSASSKSSKQSASASIKLSNVLKGHRRGVWSVKFSSKDRVIATASDDRTVKLWNVMDGQCLKTFEGHTNTILKVDFINFGTQLVSSASDGLVKVWDIKEEDCSATLDGHEDRIWALTVSKDEKRVVSGAADSKVVIWEDITEEEEEKKIEKANELVKMNQDIDNLVVAKDYQSAIVLSLKLEQPRRLLQLLQKTAESNLQEDESEADVNDKLNSITGLVQVDEAIATLSRENVLKLLEYARDWNTTVKTSDIAQRVLHVVLQSKSSQEILRLADEDEGDASGMDEDGVVVQQVQSSKKGRGKVSELLEALLSYTERHYGRADRMCSSQSFLLDYTLSQMLEGLEDEVA